jgi:hypothetical protein
MRRYKLQPISTLIAGNTKEGRGSINVPLTSLLTGLVSPDNFLFMFAKQANPNQSNRR